MQKAFLLVYLAFLVSILSAQEGAPVLTHYQESREIEDQSWAICQDKSRVMLFANRKGILAFDGQEWSSARIPVIPFSIQMNPLDEKIYVGGENDYGYIEKSDNGAYWYVSLSGDSASQGLVTKIVFNGIDVWFYSEKNISCFNTNSNERELLLTSESGKPFTGLVITSEYTFINVKNKGLFRLDNDSLLSIPGGKRTRELDILFSLPYNKELILIGLSNGKLNLFDGINFFDYQINDNGYIADNTLSEGLVIGDSLYAFSTLGGGAVVVDKLSRNVRYTINKQNGLPDDEIFAIGYDKSGGLWLSHQYGLTRADLNLPVTNFSFYPGLSGNLTTSITHNDELYVASNEGVFYLSEVRDYSEVEVLIRKDAPKSDLPATDTAADSDKDAFEPLMPSLQKSKVQEPPNTRKNIFNRIFGKKNATVTNDFEIVKEIPVKQNSSEVYQPETVAVIAPSGDQFSWKKVSRLKSINYIYKRVSGFNEKCRQLVSTPFGILAATNRGLFLINNHKSTLLVKNRYINFINWEPFGDRYSVAANDGYFFISRRNNNWNVEVPDPDFTNPLYSIILTENNTVWLGGENVAYKANLNEWNDRVNYFQYSVKNDFPQRYLLNLQNDSLFLFSETGVYLFDETGDQFIPFNPDFFPASQEENYSYPLSNVPLIKYGAEWIDPQKEIMEKDVSLLKLFDNILSINTEKDNIWIIDGGNNLFRINMKRSSRVTPDTDLFVKGIKNESGISFDLSNIVFNRGDNVIYFDIVAPTYLKKNLTEYQYYISKIMDDWSPWSAQTSYSKLIPKSGDYVLQIRAKDLWGQVGTPVSLMFTIKAPFTKTTLFYFLLVSVFLVLIFLFVRFRERQLQEENRILEKKVSERTARIAAQKEEITSSIEYASRIQMAMLPMTDLFQEAFADYFIIFKPRDIVSGDFYWIGEDEENIFLTVADCTGHGVPGAFMSTLGISILNEITTHNRDLQANTILNLLRDKIKTSLHQTGKEGEAADGMDISLCVIKKNNKSIQFSGAYNPLIIYTKGELREYKADRMPIGIHYGNEASFTNYEISVKKGDAFYIFSDGLNDQFGGPDGSKYKKSNFKSLLSEICEKPMAEQKRIIENEFKQWKGKAEQVDDITIIGVRI